MTGRFQRDIPLFMAVDNKSNEVIRKCLFFRYAQNARKEISCRSVSKKTSLRNGNAQTAATKLVKGNSFFYLL